jgi:hypothetical protein
LLIATEIQNIQIGKVLNYESFMVVKCSVLYSILGDGDVVRKVPIPIYMVFPRLFTCPTLSTANFKLGNPLLLHFRKISGMSWKFLSIEFEVNISVVFEDNHLVSENFPIYITRFWTKYVIIYQVGRKSAEKLSCLIIPFFYASFALMPHKYIFFYHSLQKKLIWILKIEKKDIDGYLRSFYSTCLGVSSNTRNSN